MKDIDSMILDLIKSLGTEFSTLKYVYNKKITSLINVNTSPSSDVLYNVFFTSARIKIIKPSDTHIDWVNV